MKKFILGLIASASIMTANAQAGSWLLYGNVSVKADSLASTIWSFSPGLGYQFNDNWTVGINVSWSQGTLGLTSAGNPDVLNTYWGGPFVRYTHSISNIFYCYTQLDLSYMGQYETPGSSPSINKGTGFGANITPALGVNVGKGCALNFSIGSLGYSTMSITPADGVPSVTSSMFGLSFGKVMTIGFSKNFGGHMHSGSMEPGSDLRGMKNTKDDDDK